MNLQADITHASLLIRLGSKGPEREVAWTDFYQLYAPVIAGFARRMGAVPKDVDDLVQEVLQSFFKANPEFVYEPAKGRFRGYLKTCVWKKLASARRKKTVESHGIKHCEPDDVAIEAAWNDVWETERLGRALSAVRQRYAINAERRRTFAAFEMCTLLDRPVEQVAAELQMSLESVRAAKSRVSKALREEFDNLDEFNG